jgi:hypothetical protein
MPSSQDLEYIRQALPGLTILLWYHKQIIHHLKHD